MWSQQAYVKPSSSDIGDSFGWSVALSGNGETLAVGAVYEDSDAAGIDGNQANDSASGSGAVFVFERGESAEWSHHAYVKASNAGEGDGFGNRLVLSEDGTVLAVTAGGESGNDLGIDGDQANNAASTAGAGYVFVHDDMGVWSQQAYVKASNTGTADSFGSGIAMSSDGFVIAVGARQEDSSSTGVDVEQDNNASPNSGAVYLY